MKSIGIEHVFSIPLRPHINGGGENSVKQVKRILHQAIVHLWATGRANWDMILPQSIATLNSYCPLGSLLSRQNLCFNPYYGGYKQTIQYNNDFLSYFIFNATN